MGKSRFRCFLVEKDLTFYNSETVHGKDKACAQPEGPEAKSNNDDDMIVLIVAIFVDIFDEMGIGDDNIVQGVLFNWSRPKSFELKLHIWSMTHL